MKQSEMKNNDFQISSFIFFPLFQSLVWEIEFLWISWIADTQIYNAGLNLGLCFLSPARKTPKAINMLLVLLHFTKKASPENTSIFSMIQ